MKYEIVADLFLPRPEDCSEDGDTRIVRERYLVFDHFGDKTLSQSDAISDSCLP